MQKTLTFLEHNVQWFALALGGIFVLYCAYAYVFIPPATVKIPGQPQAVLPGDVSETTAKFVREEQRKIKENDRFAAIPVDDLVKPWLAQMGAPVSPPLPSYAFNSQPGSDKLVFTGHENTLIGVQVAKLPELPKAQPQTPQSGLSVVALPAQAGAVAAQPVAAQDQLWVTVPFVVPAKDLKDAFAKPLNGKPLDPQLYSTDILLVDLQRQRAIGVDSSGQPIFPTGDEGVENVPPPVIQQNDLKVMPDAAAPDPVKADFVDWASKNITLITQPKFYDVKGGDPWQTPEVANVNAGGAAANPAAPALPPGRIPAQPLPLPFNPNAAAGAGAGAGNAGHMDPLSLAKDVVLWAHDETVKPGQIYHYRVVYHMKNPVVSEQGIGAPEIVNILDVKSPPSDWSAAVKIKEKTEFFLTAVRPRGDVQLDVFHWEKGKWTKESPTLAPGDQIPQTDWAIVDVHGSGSAQRDRYVLLTDDAGNVRHRYPSDRGSERYKDLLQQSSAPAAAANNPNNNPVNKPTAPKPGAPSNDNTHGKRLAGPDLSK